MTLEAELEALEAMDMVALRRAWRGVWGSRPNMRSADLLRHLIAWRIQVAACGGLDRATKDALKRTNSGGTRGKLPIGSRLSREWKGVRYEVEVTAEGYRHDGQTYRSLSAVATAIAGTRWNGWRFFGLGDASAPVRKRAA